MTSAQANFVRVNLFEEIPKEILEQEEKSLVNPVLINAIYNIL